MIDDWKCDAKCMSQNRWDRTNPMDYAQGLCGCKPPIGPQAEVVDWTAEDFYTVSMQEWINIHEQNQMDIEEENAEDVISMDQEEPVEEAEESVTQLEVKTNDETKSTDDASKTEGT
jgi:hypothetical protein